MLNKITAISTAILATASALTQSKSWNALDQLARFDNIQGVPVLAVGPINEYLDIYWQGMSLVETGGIQNIAIISANSPSNYAAFSALDTATATQGQPSMMANYPDSTIDHFDLKSFYYACALASQASVVGVPQACTITIKGYADDNAQKLMATQSFSYKVDTLQLSSQMVEANVNSDFNGLKRVDFFVDDNLLKAGLIDTVSYKVYSASKF
jgi:hypothetical protein